MSKTTKKILFIIIALIVIGIMSLIYTKNQVKSYYVGQELNINTRTLGENYKDVYCVEHGNFIYYGNGDTYFKITKIIEMTQDDQLRIGSTVINDNNKKEAYKRLFAILADTSISNDRSIQNDGRVDPNNVFENNPKNNYIWDLIYSSTNLFNDISETCLGANDGYKGLGAGYNISGKRYTGKLYLLENTNNAAPGTMQKLILVESATEILEPPTVKIELRKVKKENTTEGLAGAKIGLEGIFNVDSISFASSTELTSNSKGYFGTSITIKPIANTGNITIKVTEEVTPNGYKQLTTRNIGIKYNKTTGIVTSVTDLGTNPSMIYKDGNYIKIKNEKIPNEPVTHTITLKPKKIDGEYNTGLSGATIEFEGKENVKTMKTKKR